ncbi:hypothetical protein J8C00_14685 [Chloracidobacterium sp. E]|nr:hypothetical protein [Chloracidobacterium aggregatum]QUV98236.1 hypothetical protein J8C00_14685 [Chloracidobacterium sp. E]
MSASRVERERLAICHRLRMPPAFGVGVGAAGNVSASGNRSTSAPESVVASAANQKADAQPKRPTRKAPSGTPMTGARK